MKTRLRTGRMLAGLTLAGCLLTAPLASAQPRKPTDKAAPKDDKPKDDKPKDDKPKDEKAEKLAEARKHYEDGLRLYDAENMDAARVEFERAYALTPNYKILYNLGLILKYKTDYVGALKNFELYLEEGVDAPEARKQEVQKEIAQLKQLVATVDVTTNVAGADVTIDDVIVAKTPLTKPILLNPGRRRIGATKKGRLPASKALDVGSRDKLTVPLELGEEKQIIVVEKPTRRLPWVGYIVTGALAAGAGVTGYVAISASSTLKDERGNAGVSASRLDTLSNRTKTFGYVADGLGIGAIIAAGISVYYTIKWTREDNARTTEKAPPPTPAKASWLVSPGGVAGTF